VVSQPGTLSYLELGWILTADGQPQPVQDVDFQVTPSPKYCQGNSLFVDFVLRLVLNLNFSAVFLNLTTNREEIRNNYDDTDNINGIT
jgi:hypothetical protein